VIVLDGRKEKGGKHMKEHEGREGEGGGERERRTRRKGGRCKQGRREGGRSAKEIQGRKGKREARAIKRAGTRVDSPRPVGPALLGEGRKLTKAKEGKKEGKKKKRRKEKQIAEGEKGDTQKGESEFK
jgi:hypothetical protein